jgi:hypothetical protein
MESLTILGKPFHLVFAPTIGAEDLNCAGAKLTAAIKALNANSELLSPEEIKAISQMESLHVSGSADTYLGETSPNGMTLSMDYIHASTYTWLASLIGHEGQHALNTGQFKDKNLWKDEQSAGALQLSLGKKIGFPLNEIKYLENWIVDTNQIAMQQHMETGFKYVQERSGT